MNAIAITSTITTEELFALPDDGIERDLIRGELREYPITRRSRLHSEVMMAVGEVLRRWVRTCNRGGRVPGGEAGARLRREPETTVGMDVAYFSAESIAQMPSDQGWYEGPPVLAVEILSPSDTHENVVEKINLYLECGVAVVWILDPDFQTLTVYRPNSLPLMLRSNETLDGYPELPGLSAPVQDFFN
ncbi:MAG: Uma2 family endonuclease [Planctomycetota bacterium]